jgi:F-type H+-transporting ATPase subunit b
MDLDITLLIQMVLFVGVLATLNGILFQPFLRLLEEREHRIQGLAQEAERLRAEGDRDHAEYREKLQTARDEAHQRREELLKEGREKERQILSEARTEVAEKLQKARLELGQWQRDAGDTLASERSSLAALIVDKVLGDKGLSAGVKK